MKVLPFFLTVCLVAPMMLRAAGPAVTDYASIQEAIDQNPGKLVEVPAGDYSISQTIMITKDGSGLFGAGRIIQTDPTKATLSIKDAGKVEIRDITLTRPAADEGHPIKSNGIDAANCTDLVVQNVKVLENRSNYPSMNFAHCDNSRVTNCLVENYMALSIDDRTAGNDWGFAFSVIDGTGMVVEACHNFTLQGNTVIERKFVPTQEIKAQYKLGQFVKRNPQKGLLPSQEMWDSGYYNAWHQGSGIVIGSPARTGYIQILGNLIENAAQGLDVHADNVIVSGNIINNAFIGMKAMHGSRNVSIVGNQFCRNDLWSIGLMPGAGSHPTGIGASPEAKGSALEQNIDGGSIIANNIITDFGHGTADWMWKDAERAPLRFDTGQKDFNPPLNDVIVQGNVVYDTGRDMVMKDGKPVVEPPRYQWAVFISQAKGGPTNLHFSNNLLHPGSKGISNVPLPQ